MSTSNRKGSLNDNDFYQDVQFSPSSFFFFQNDIIENEIKEEFSFNREIEENITNNSYSDFFASNEDLNPISNQLDFQNQNEVEQINSNTRKNIKSKENNSKIFPQKIKKIEEKNEQPLIEIGKNAVWSLSSAKKGCGVLQIRDNNLKTFWQSDGCLPHLCSIQFPKIVKVREIWIFLDYQNDESYTPQQISIRTGTGFHDLEEIKLIDENEPNGWLKISFTEEYQDFDFVVYDNKKGEKKKKKVFIKKQRKGDILTNFLQIAILDNHQQGKDTHIRQIKIFGPPSNSLNDTIFNDLNFSIFSVLR